MWNIRQSSTRIVAWDDISTTAQFRAFALGLLYWILTQNKTEISEKHSKVCATRYLYGIRPTKVHTSPRILQPDLCPRRENLTWLHCNFRALHPLTLYKVLLAPWWQTAQMIASMQGSSNRKSHVLFFQSNKPVTSEPLNHLGLTLCIVSSALWAFSTRPRNSSVWSQHLAAAHKYNPFFGTRLIYKYNWVQWILSRS